MKPAAFGVKNLLTEFILLAILGPVAGLFYCHY